MRQPRPGRGADLRWALVWTLIALAVYALFFGSAFRSLGLQSDALNYCSAARSILRGQGAVTGMAFPTNWRSVPDGKHVEAQSLLSPLAEPLWPLSLAAAFRLFGAADRSAALCCGLFFVLCVPLVFLLAAGLFGRGAAHLAAALTVLNPTLLYNSVNGMSESLFTCLLVLAALLLSKPSGMRRGLAAGLALAALCLTRQIGPFFAAPLALLALLERERRWPRLAGLALGLALVFAAGWAARPLIEYSYDGPQRVPLQPAVEQAAQPPAAPAVAQSDQNQAAAARPGESWLDRFFQRHADVLLTHSPLYPAHSYSRGLEQGERISGREHLKAIAYRALHFNLPVTLKAWFVNGSNPLVLWGFWLAPLLALRERKQRRFWLIVLAMLLVVAALLTLMFVMARYYQPALPLLIVFAAAGCARLLERIKRADLRRSAAVALVLAGTFPWGISAGFDRECRFSDRDCCMLTVPDPAFYQELGRSVAELSAPQDVGVSDTPWLVSWYGDRACIWLPNDMDTLKRLQRRANVDFMLLTFHQRGTIDLSFWSDWLERAAAVQGALDGFSFERGQVLPSGKYYYFRSHMQYKTDAINNNMQQIK